jgi:hypothetical protein
MSRRYRRNWTTNFDYFYIMYSPDGWTDPLPRSLIPIASGREFVLYRIVKPAR